jgi:hypothetical protein
MTSAVRLTRSLLALAALAAGCGDSLQPVLCDGGRCGAQVSWRKSYNWNYGSQKVDLLFVVDDTAAMAAHRDALAAGFTAMAQRLRGPVAPTSIHAGFIRAGSCDTSARAHTACGFPGTGTYFLRSEWCHTRENFPGDYAETFACLGDLGAANCAPSRPLAAAGRFLTEPEQPGWDGLVRPDATLAIVIVTAQDDASLEPAREIAAAIKARKPDPSQVAVSVIGPGGDCAGGEAPGPRLLEFVQQFGANGIYLPLCSGQFPAALDRVEQLISVQISPWCVTNVRDTDPATPGLQADCAVEDVTTDGLGGFITRQVPSCDESSPPCWRMVAGAGVSCGGYIFDLARGPEWCVEASPHGTIECLACADSSDPACKPVPGA